MTTRVEPDDRVATGEAAHLGVPHPERRADRIEEEQGRRAGISQVLDAQTGVICRYELLVHDRRARYRARERSSTPLWRDSLKNSGRTPRLSRAAARDARARPSRTSAGARR